MQLQIRVDSSHCAWQVVSNLPKLHKPCATSSGLGAPWTLRQGPQMKVFVLCLVPASGGGAVSPSPARVRCRRTVRGNSWLSPLFYVWASGLALFIGGLQGWLSQSLLPELCGRLMLLTSCEPGASEIMDTIRAVSSLLSPSWEDASLHLWTQIWS